MLMTNVVEAILLKHRCQVVLLDHPDTFSSEALSDIANKAVRILEIIKHCNACVYLGLLVTKFVTEYASFEEVVENPVSSFPRIFDEILRGLEADQCNPGPWVAAQ